jgi:tetratricopeptide (TPR) repeat protein
VDEAAFRFRHLLVRDAAYGAIPKRRRAALHRLFAEWLSARAGTRTTEFQEILGYHLEQAYRYLCELGPPDPETVAIGDRSAEFLYAAGRRAMLRGDQAARQLLQRAVDLVSDERRQLEMEIDLAKVPTMPGLEAVARLASVHARALAAGEELLALRARTEELWSLSWTDPIGAPGRITELDQHIGRLRQLHDLDGLARAVRLQAEEHFQAGRGALALELIEEAIAAAREVGDLVLEEQALERRLQYMVAGPTHANDGVAAAKELLSRPGRLGRGLRAETLKYLAVMLAMLGRSEEARAALAEGSTIEAQLGWRRPGQAGGAVLMLTGDLAGAEEELRAGLATLEEAGGIGMAATSRAQLGQVLFARGATDEAMEKVETVEAITSPDDISAVIPARCVRAEVLAARGEWDGAIQLAESAVALADTSDWPGLRGEARLSQARVLAASGHAPAAMAAAKAAEDSFFQKGNVVYLERARLLLRDLEGSARGR